MDDLDGRLIDLFAAEPRIGVLEASRRLGVARGTVQARLDKLVASGVVTGWGPELSPEALGYPVTAFLTLEIRQERQRRPRRGRRAPGRRSPRCSRRTRSPAPATCGPAWWPAPTPTSSGSSTWCSQDPAIVRSLDRDRARHPVPYRVLPLARAEAVSLTRAGRRPRRRRRRPAGAIASMSRAPPSVTMPTLASRPSTPRTGRGQPAGARPAARPR